MNKEEEICSVLDSGSPVVYFKEEGHEYQMSGKKILSVNGVLDLFSQKFEDKYWLNYKAFQRCLGEKVFKKVKNLHFKGVGQPSADEFFPILSNYTTVSEFFNSKKEIRGEWDLKRETASEKGTEFHKMMEDECYELGFRKNPFTGEDYKVKCFKKKFDNESLMKDLYKLEDGCYPELLCFNEEYMIAGQADLVFIKTLEDGARVIDIDDFKTNLKPPDNNGRGQYMKPPISHLRNSKVSKYRLQMSFYGYLLEMFGYKVRNLGYTHYKDYDKSKGTMNDIPYLRKEIIDIIEEYSKIKN